MHPGFRKTVGRLLLAAFIMTGGAVLAVSAIMEVVGPGASVQGPGGSGGPGSGPAVDASGYSTAFTQDVLYGATAHWNPTKVASARDQGVALEGKLASSEQAAKALLGDQIAFMGWLLDCHDAMAGALDQVGAGIFGADQDILAGQLDSCGNQALDLVTATRTHAAAYPNYRFSSVPGYGTWDSAAFATMALLDLPAAAAVDSLTPYASFFHGPAAPGFASLSDVEAFLQAKAVGPALGSARSDAVVLVSPKVDSAGAVGFWIRQAQGLGKTDVRLEVRVSGVDVRFCSATADASYCPAGTGNLVQTVWAANATYNGHVAALFWAPNPSDETEWGTMVRNGGTTDLTGLKVHVECYDGTLATDWEVPDIPAESQSFTSHAFGDDDGCPARIQLLDGDGKVIVERTGEIAGPMGFAL